MSGPNDQQTVAAIKRLNGDWKEIQKNPTDCVSATPLEKDIFEVFTTTDDVII